MYSKVYDCLSDKKSKQTKTKRSRLFCHSSINVAKFANEELPFRSKVEAHYLTLVVPSATRLVSMEAHSVPFYPLPLSVLPFMGI